MTGHYPPADELADRVRADLTYVTCKECGAERWERQGWEEWYVDGTGTGDDERSDYREGILVFEASGYCPDCLAQFDRRALESDLYKCIRHGFHRRSSKAYRKCASNGRIVNPPTNETLVPNASD